MHNVLYSHRFLKDLKNLQGCSEYKKIEDLCFRKLCECKYFDDIDNLKKIAGYKNYYRIRLSDYRIGFKVEDRNWVLLRVLHRKDIYKFFP